MKTWIWTLIVAPLLLIVGYGGMKYVQYSREWEQFEAAWQKVEAGVKGRHGYVWTPGVFSAVGEMDLADCGITDDKLVHLEGVTTLVKLNLSDNDVTDAGLAHLVKLPGLRELDLRGTQVSDRAVQKLREALPLCQIER